MLGDLKKNKKQELNNNECQRLIRSPEDNTSRRHDDFDYQVLQGRKIRTSNYRDGNVLF